MMLFDTHMHADYSCDAEMTIGEAVETAKKLGIGMILTEHWDRYYPTNPEAFLFDINDYIKKNAKYRSDRVLLGIEMGFQPQAIEEDKVVAKSHPFDEVVGSMHCYRGLDMYEPTTYEGVTKDQAVGYYLEDSIKCLDMKPNFDTYGHIDYICRYWPYEDKNLHYSEHADLWDEVFKRLIEQDKSIEINTRRLQVPGAVETLTELYMRYKEMGGKYVTLGSDAHVTKAIGANFEAAEKMAQECGLEIVYYARRQRKLCREYQD
jgi:histidinol-phosphatase (PHP family)